MLKSIRLAGGLLAFAMIALVLSCSDDKSNIGGGGSVPVADGFYVTKVGITPVSSSQLVAEQVEADAFASQDRSGFLANYVYLTAGSYNIVSVIDQEISKTLGGAAVVETNETIANPDGTGSDCDLHAYILVEEFAEAGAAIVIATEGLYKVSMDNETKEFVFYNIVKGQLIGAASPAGWSSSALQDMTGAATATGVAFELSDVEMRPGQYKLRFNCRWGIERRIDPAASPGHEFNNGYVAYTNFGGATTANLAAGGANFEIALGQDGMYDFMATWTPADGFEFTVTKVSSLDPITFNPDDFAWGIIGAGAPTNSWATDSDLNYEGKTGSTYKWKGTFTITNSGAPNGGTENANGEFKFRTNNSWDYNKGFGDFTKSGSKLGLLTDSGGNFKAGTTGTFIFEITTSDDGVTWSIKID